MTIRELITKLRIDSDKGRVQAYNEELGRTKKGMRLAGRQAFMMRKELKSLAIGMKTLIAIAAGSQIVRWFTTGFSKGADEAAKFARATGIAIESYQGLAYAVQLEGGDVGDMNKSLQQLSKRALEVTQGNKTTAMSFRQLGVDVRDATTGKLKTADQLLYDVADAVKAMGEDPRRTGLLMQILGRSGAKMAVLLKNGAAGIREYIEQAKKLGIVMTKEQAAVAEKFNDEMLRAKSAVLGLRNMIAVELLPAITGQLKAFREWMMEGDNAAKLLHRIKLGAKVAAVALGTLAAVKLKTALFTIISVLKRLVIWFQLTGNAAIFTRAKLMIATVAAKFQSAGDIIKRSLMSLTTWFKATGAAAMWAQIKIFAIVGAFVLLILLIEDLIGFASGKDSLIGRILGDSELGKSFKSELQSLGRAAKELWAEVSGLAKDVWKEAGPALKELWVELKPLLKDLWAFFKMILPPLVKAQIFIWRFLIFAVKMWIKWIKLVVRALRNVWEAAKWVGGKIAELWQALGEYMSGVFETVGDAWRTVIDGILKAWETVKKPFEKIANAIGGFFKSAAEGVGAAWHKAIGWIEKVVNKIVSGVKAAVEAVDRLRGKGKGGELGLGLGSSLVTLQPGVSNPGNVTAHNNQRAIINLTVNGANMKPDDLRRATVQAAEEALQALITGTYKDRAEVAT